MSRFAKCKRVFFVEEPVEHSGAPHMAVNEVCTNLFVCTPHLPAAAARESELWQRELLEALLAQREVVRPILWFYTPMALPLILNLEPELVIYDCMDELSAFRGAPPELVARERQLFARADLVFTGGQSLFESKRWLHSAIFAFPSSVDAEHFAAARARTEEPFDQRNIPGDRLGFFGVLDERMDLELLATLARERPEYQIVMIGPVVKIPEDALPRLPNIHYLGSKPYPELPAYISGWKVALMPFALNESTRFISPTKTLEYMAAGKPIVSTPIRDVVSPYGESGLVRIADQRSFADAVDAAAATELGSYVDACDRVLERTSWDRTWSGMYELLCNFRRGRRALVQEEGNDSCSTT